MPHVDKEALETLIWEAELQGSWPGLDANDDAAAADILDKTCRQLSEFRHEVDLGRWLLVAVWIAGGPVFAYLGNEVNPVEAWYEWPILGVAGFVLAGVALSGVYGVTVLLHYFWWQRFGGGRRDAQFYGDPLTRRPGARRRGTRRLLDKA